MLKVIFTGILLAAGPAQGADLKGKIIVDGSSTVSPITEAVAEEFRDEARKVRVSVGVSGTGGGFKKFAKGESDINNASRPIKDKEASAAKKIGIDFIQLPVAFDGLSVVVQKGSPISNVTIEQLNKLWMPSGANQANTWKDLGLSDSTAKIKLFGPGPDSGTFDYFTKKVNGKTALSRSDYSSSEDDNVIVKGVSSDKNALGYFGYAYYLENQDKLKALSINGIAPTSETISSNKYPLARRIYIYVSQKSAARPEVEKFVNFYLNNAGRLAKDVGYLPLPKNEYADAKASFAKFVQEAKSTKASH